MARSIIHFFLNANKIGLISWKYSKQKHKWTNKMRWLLPKDERYTSKQWKWDDCCVKTRDSNSIVQDTQYYYRITHSDVHTPPRHHAHDTETQRHSHRPSNANAVEDYHLSSNTQIPVRAKEEERSWLIFVGTLDCI